MTHALPCCHPTGRTSPYLPSHIPGEVAVGDKLEVALITRLVVDNFNFTRLQETAEMRSAPPCTSSRTAGKLRHEGQPAPNLVDPQLSHDDVVHGGGDLFPRVVVAGGMEDAVDGA